MAAYTTIDDPSAYFKVQLYTGTGSSLTVTFNDTDTDMQPDLVWIATRSTTENQPLYDVVRGTGESVHSNDNDTEATEEGVSSFNSDGFTLGTHGGANQSSATHVAWCWKAGTTSGITTNGNTTITPSAYSFNQTSGFSILKYSGNGTAGAKIAHGLGAAPELVFYKSTTGAFDWLVYSKALGATKEIVLNSAAASTTSDVFNDEDPTSTNLEVKTNAGNNSSSHDYIAYCWAPIQGFSKFGSFVGNGNVDGAFVFTGFRPAFVMIKCATRAGTDIWTMYDNKREGYNVDNDALSADTNAAERTSDDIDILSNGFKCRNSVTDVNPSGETAVYIAFAEAPFVNSSGVPCNAR